MAIKLIYTLIVSPILFSSNPDSLQSHYQAWELKSFDDINDSQKTNHENSTDHLTPSVSEQQNNADRAQGYQSGFDQGYADGLEQGLAQGLAQGFEQATLKAEEEYSQLQVQLSEKFNALFNVYENDLNNAREHIATEILEFSLYLTRAMVNSALKVQPELLITIIEQSLNALPCLELPAKLHINPLDAPLVDETLGQQLTQSGWKIIKDPNVEPGGCKINTATNEIDATIATRWQYLQLSLGQSTEWLKSN
jgi:flagellar assembly protein FliH